MHAAREDGADWEIRSLGGGFGDLVTTTILLCILLFYLYHRCVDSSKRVAMSDCKTHCRWQLHGFGS